MRLLGLNSKALIVPDMEARTKEAVLRTLVACMTQEYPHIDGARALEALLERERLGSTGVGNGIAIPHARLPALPQPVACFGRSLHGVDYGSLDGQPAHLFLALIAPEGNTALHLKTLARASRLFRDAAFRACLMDVETADELWQLIHEKDGSLATA
jgi:nitrogen PTS system EIIA component